MGRSLSKATHWGPITPWRCEESRGIWWKGFATIFMARVESVSPEIGKMSLFFQLQAWLPGPQELKWPGFW